MEAAQDYITSEMQSAYAKQGMNINRRTFETVVRSLGNTTKIINNPKDTDYTPGDIVPYTVVQDYNRNLKTIMAVKDAVGYKTAKSEHGLKKGHVLTEADLQVLKMKGVQNIEVEKDAIQHAPLLKGINSLPLLRQDWMAALGYSNIAKNLTEGAGQRWSTDIAGYHPIPAYAHGATFGQGDKGKY